MSRRAWTEWEVQYLEKKYESHGADYIAKKLDRTEQSVKRKAQKLGLNTYETEFLRMKQICIAFQIDARVVHRWIEKFGLPMKEEKHGQMSMYGIITKDFWKWAKEHKDLIPWCKYQEQSLLPEPEWVRGEVLNYKLKNNRKPITKNVVHEVRKRIGKTTYKRIADELGRTTDSIKHIAYANGL